MASIRPFRGLRYNTRSPLDLALVTAPPYDCITTEQQNDLYRVHPHNIVRLILNRATSSDSAGDNRYSRAAQLLRLWREGGILSQDEKPAVYIIEHEFDVEGKRYRREGFIARVGLEEPESRIVLPHEETFTGPKEDRLKLLRATDCNLSAVMSLFDDPAGAVMAALKQGLPHAPDMQTVDGEGVVNRLWVQADPEVISAAQKLSASHSLYIADGHHRYETAAAYMKLLRESGREVRPEHPAASIMTFCIPMSDPGLVIQPTHRVIEDLGGKFDLDRFRSLSSRYFEWKQFHGSYATTPNLSKALDEQSVPAMGLYVRGAPDAFLLSLKDAAVMKEFAPEHSKLWHTLDVAVLHTIVMERMLPEALDGQGGGFEISYVHRSDQAFDAVYEDGKPLSFILRPPKIETLRKIASAGELMPHKSTYFYPKILSGIVLNPLE